MAALRVRNILHILSVNLLLCIVGVATIELVFGNWLGGDNINKLNLIRDRKISYYIKNLYDHPSDTIEYSRDIYGLRGQFDNPSEVTILTLGGSTVDQRFIADGETWQDVLQQKLRSAGRNVVIANAGVDGQSTYGHIKNFDWWFPNIPDLLPKHIIFYIGLNDFYKKEGNRYDALREGKSLKKLIKNRSILYHLARTINGIYQAEIGYEIGHKAINFDKVAWVFNPVQRSYDELMRGRLEEYRERLSVLIDKTRKIGSTPIFVTQPSRKYRFREGRVEGLEVRSRYDEVYINGVDFYYMMRKIDHETKSVADSHGILYLDLAARDLWADEDFYDFVHMTPSGVKKVGEYLFDELNDRL